MRKTFGWIIKIVILLLVAFWLISLIKCEILTYRYFDEFKDTYIQGTMLGDIEYFKVLHCDGKTAEVYYVCDEMSSGNVLTFQRESDAWVQISWDTVWSSSGSASGVVYPYWWHFFYGKI